MTSAESMKQQPKKFIGHYVVEINPTLNAACAYNGSLLANMWNN